MNAKQKLVEEIIELLKENREYCPEDLLLVGVMIKDRLSKIEQEFPKTHK